MPTPAFIDVIQEDSGRRTTVPSAQMRVLSKHGWREATDEDPLEQTTQPDDIPTRADDVVDWVGSDPTRAQRAFDVESQRPSPRTTVTDHIASVLNPQEP